MVAWWGEGKLRCPSYQLGIQTSDKTYRHKETPLARRRGQSSSRRSGRDDVWWKAVFKLQPPPPVGKPYKVDMKSMILCRSTCVRPPRPESDGNLA
jgi:hypothetical protein